MLVKQSVKKPYSVIVAVIIIMILGVVALLGIQTDLLPDVDYPFVVIVTDYTDASPEVVEKDITTTIETALSGVDYIAHISSVSSVGRSVVTVEFNHNANMDNVVAEIREVFEPLKDEWPEEVGTPSIRKINPDAMPVVVASVDVEGKDGTEISAFVNDSLMSRFKSISGVSDISVSGIIDEQVQIAINSEKLAKINEKIFAAIDGDYEKAREAIEATDTNLNGITSQMSSSLLNQTAGIDSQLRSYNSDLSTAVGLRNSYQQQLLEQNSKIDDLYDQKAEMESTGATAEEMNKLQESISAAESEQSAIKGKLESVGSDIASLNSKISSLQSQRNSITSKMSSEETTLADSQQTLTDKLKELEEAETQEKEEADLHNLLTIEMVSSMLEAQNFSSTAGSLSLGNKLYDVRVGDEISSVEELEKLVLFHFNLEDVEDVTLADVADISRIDNSYEVYSKVDGHDAVLISFVKQSDFSTTETADEIHSVFEDIEKKYPSVTITVLSDQSNYIENIKGAVGENLLIGAILAILILLVFLKDYRPTIVVALSIPVSLLFAIGLMYFTGVSINIFSLAGLALGVGMLVDNSIVVMENIYRCRSNGLSRRDAAVAGTKQVSSALIASTLTTVCVFLPIAFTQGLSRELFGDIGLTIAYALLASLLIAFSLVPATSAGILRKMDPRINDRKHGIMEHYEQILHWVLEHRIFIVVFVLMLLAFTSILTISKGTSFLPQGDSSEMTVSIQMDDDITRESLCEATDEITSLLRETEGVKSVGAMMDNGGLISLNGISEGEGTILYVLLEDKREHTSGQISDIIKSAAEDLHCSVDISIGSYDFSSLYDEGLRIVVSGEDYEVLSGITRDMGDLLLSVEGTTHVKDSMDKATPVLKITVDKTAAMQFGLTVADIYNFISNSISSSNNATTLSRGNTDVIVVDGSATELKPADIQNLAMEVKNKDGTVSVVVIGSIAQITEEEGSPLIYRSGQSRYMVATADIDEDYNVGLVNKEVVELVSGYNVPEGYSVTIEGEEQVISTSRTTLLWVLVLALVLMYLIMVAQFQSLLIPLVIMFTIPLAFTGGFIALLVSGKDISIISLIGFLLLSGIVVNNGIVMVDCITRLKKSGKTLTEAIIEGCRIRIRPIVMTATTTVLAIMTLAFGFGTGAETIQPMAIVILGGMIYATLTTLFVVPAVYDLFMRRKTDLIAEIGGDHLPEEETDTSIIMEKRDEKESASEKTIAGISNSVVPEEKTGLRDKIRAFLFEEEEDDDGDDGDDGDEEEESNFFSRLKSRLHAEDADADDEEDEEDEDEDSDEESETGLFRRLKSRLHAEDADDEDEADDADDEDGEDDAEKGGFFRRLKSKKRSGAEVVSEVEAEAAENTTVEEIETVADIIETTENIAVDETAETATEIALEGTKAVAEPESEKMGFFRRLKSKKNIEEEAVANKVNAAKEVAADEGKAVSGTADEEIESTIAEDPAKAEEPVEDVASEELFVAEPEFAAEPENEGGLFRMKSKKHFTVEVAADETDTKEETVVDGDTAAEPEKEPGNFRMSRRNRKKTSDLEEVKAVEQHEDDLQQPQIFSRRKNIGKK